MNVFPFEAFVGYNGFFCDFSVLTHKWVKRLLLTGVENCSALAEVGIFFFPSFLARGQVWCAISEMPSMTEYARAVLLRVIIKQEV